MSGKASGEVWEFDLPTNEKLVCLALADHADHNGENVYPSQALIAWKTGFSVRHVRRLLKSLIEKRAIVLHMNGKVKGRPNTYAIDFEHAPRLPPYRGKLHGRTSESPTLVGQMHVLPDEKEGRTSRSPTLIDTGRTSRSPARWDLQESDKPSLTNQADDDVQTDSLHHQVFDASAQASAQARDLALLHERFARLAIPEAVWSRWGQPIEHQLACVLHAEGEGAKPPGLLRTMLDGDGVPLPKYVARAQRLLGGPAITPEQQARPPTPAPAPIGLDEHPGGGALTVRDIWSAVVGQLKLQLNQDTFANVRDVMLLGYADGVITLQPRRPYAAQWFERAREMLDKLVSDVAGVPLAVRCEVVHAEEPATHDGATSSRG